MKTLFYPALHFNNPFPSDVRGEMGVQRKGGLESETQGTAAEMSVKLRARGLWVGMCAWGT